MPRFAVIFRLVLAACFIISNLLPAAVILARPALQTEEPPPATTSTPEATASAQPPLETETATPAPVETDTATVPPPDTSTPPATDTPLSPATDTPAPTATTQPLPETETPTPGPTDTVIVTETPTEVITATPTVTPTATLTPTLSPEPVALDLVMAVNPAFVTAGELVTVTMTLSNPGQIPSQNLTISSPLPAELGYDTPLGAVNPGFNPMARLLTWQIPPELSVQPSLTFGFVGRIAADTPASAINLIAEMGSPPFQAQTSLVIVATSTPTPTPTATPFPVGPPATLQLGVEAGPGERAGEQRKRWLTVYVTDADGLAVADETEVQLSSQGGTLAETQLRTRDGVATTRLMARPGDTGPSAPRPVQPRVACNWDRAQGRRRCWPTWDWAGRGTDRPRPWSPPATPCAG